MMTYVSNPTPSVSHFFSTLGPANQRLGQMAPDANRTFSERFKHALASNSDSNSIRFRLELYSVQLRTRFGSGSNSIRFRIELDSVRFGSPPSGKDSESTPPSWASLQIRHRVGTGVSFAATDAADSARHIGRRAPLLYKAGRRVARLKRDEIRRAE